MLTYPNNSSNAPYLVDLPDEHTTIMPLASGGYLVFGASKISGGTGGAAVLQTTDLKNFTFATSLGYNRQVMNSPVAINQCNPTYQTEFDGNYAAPGSVVQDPTLPGGVNQQPYYATVGFARSSDSGKTWPAPENGVMGGPDRHPVLMSSDPQPTAPHPPMGNAIPSAFVDKSSDGSYYLYVVYGYHPAPGGTTDGRGRVARARLGPDPLTFLKWYNGSFNQPGIGGSDTGVLPSVGCGGQQQMSEISYNDDLGLYLMLYVCVSGPQGSRTGAWYYATATSLDLQNWTPGQMVLNSQFPITEPCSADGMSGGQFDGWYPSSMSPSAAAGHTKLAGKIFFQNGCDTGTRQFVSRTFTITASSAATPVLTDGTVANGATYVAGGLVPGSWAQVKGANLATTMHIGWSDTDYTGLGNSLPTNLNGTQVSVNGIAAAVYAIIPTQVDFQVPAGVSGTASVQVSVNGVGSNAVTAAAANNSPGIFPCAASGTNYPCGYFPDGKFVGDPAIAPAYRKAKAGDVIQMFSTGVAPSPAGVRVTQQPVSGVSVTLGTITVPADAAVLVYPGEFQVNFTVPPQFATMPEGNYPLTITVNGVTSPANINSNPPAPVVVPIQH